MLSEASIERVVADLLAFSGDMTDGMEAPRERPVGEAPGGRMQALIVGAETLLQLAPVLLGEIADAGNGDVGKPTESTRPVRARLSRSPRDWRRVEGRLLPERWIGFDPDPALPAAPLRWLLHLADTLFEALREARRRHEARMNEAARARDARDSAWVAREVRALEARSRRIEELEQRLGALRSAVLQAAPTRITPSERLPQPYPHGEAWRSLRRRAPAMLDPRRALASWGAWIAHGVHPADFSFLYQRWCGLEIVRGLRALGLDTGGDVAGALLYGGRLTFTQGGLRVELWIEPQLVRGRRHASGFTCIQGRERAPDYLLVTDGPRGRSAFVLDATLATEDEALQEKARYIDDIAATELPIVAGVPAAQEAGAPELAWAIAPVRAPHGRHLRRDGRSGVIPLHPEIDERGPLIAFLEEVVRHARAWRASGVSDASPPPPR